MLVAGGGDGNSAVFSSELYDPATGNWSATGTAPAISFAAPAILLQNGKVLAVGNGPGTSQLYDSEKGSWSSTGSLPAFRRSYTATLLPNGKVLVAGGFDMNGTTVATTAIYDPANESWSPAKNLAEGRQDHTATLLPNGKVLVAGGYSFVPPPSSEDGAIISCEIYDPATGNWSSTADLLTKRKSHTATLLPSGKVLVAGGSDVNLLNSTEVYDPATGFWNPAGDLAEIRLQHTATLLPNGSVLVVGGIGENPSGFATAAEIFDPGTGNWSGAGNMQTGRALHTATLLPNGQVLIAAGWRHMALSSAELYGPAVPGRSALLQNISTRGKVLTGDKALIGGFIITGNAPKKVMLRGTGPSLPLAGVLTDPTLELYLPNGTTVTNDNWKIDDQTGQSQEAEIQATTIPPARELEPALVRTLDPGNYTAIVRGKNGGEGIALVEAYDLDAAAPSELANISTRGFVDTGDDVMIGGIISGPLGWAGGEVMVRVLGPSLSFADSLDNPTVELRNSNGAKLVSNNDWKVSDSTGQSQEAQIQATGIPPSHDSESAFVIVLQPGNYTAIVSGKNGGTGIGLVEVYNLH